MWGPESTEDVNSFITAHVGLAIALAKEKGYSMPFSFSSWISKLAVFLSILTVQVGEVLGEHRSKYKKLLVGYIS